MPAGLDLDVPAPLRPADARFSQVKLIVNDASALPAGPEPFALAATLALFARLAEAALLGEREIREGSDARARDRQV